MLGQNSFYHSLTRNYIIAFGNIFSDITVVRFNKAGNAVQNIPVPIKYGPKSKYLADIDTPPEDQRVSLTLPAIAFYDSNLSPDPERSLNSVNILSGDNPQLTRSLNKTFMPRPYKMTIEMSIMTKNVEDGAQIVEQIIPFFNPSVTRSLNLIDGLKPFDIQIELTGMSKDHSYEEVSRQFVLWTLTFDMSIWLFGPVSNQGVIKQTIVSFIDNNTDKKLASVTTQPGLTADGKPTTDINQSIDYKLIKSTDDYGFIENIEEFII